MEIQIKLNRNEAYCVRVRCAEDPKVLSPKLRFAGTLHISPVGAMVVFPEDTRSMDGINSVMEAADKACPLGGECPICQEADTDSLLFDENENLHCGTCHTVYDPNQTPTKVLYEGVRPNPVETN